MPGALVDQANATFLVTQSWLQDFLRCPERARRQLTESVSSLNDATATGTAVHQFMELRLGGKPYQEAFDAAWYWLEYTATNDPKFEWAIVQTMETLFRHFGALVDGMDRHVLPQVPPGGVIERTVRAVLGTHDGWTIVLEGTPDYLDPFGRLWDWKTSRDDYSVHEAQAWMIQPTAYTYLASQDRAEPVTDFTYAIGIKPNGTIQLVDVVRGPQDWAWLARIAGNALDLHRALPDSWPVHHGHYLCSERWCPFWATCRGAYLSSPA